MRTNRLAVAVLLLILVLGQLFSQAKESTDQQKPTLESLTARIAALEDFIRQATFESIFIKDPNSQAFIVLQVDNGNPNMLIFDKTGTKKIEIGLSSLINDGLIALYGQEPAKSVYVWNGSCVPARMDWAIMALNAEKNSSGFLSEKLIKTALVASYSWNQEAKTYDVLLQIDTDPQPVWSSIYLGTGRFSVSDREVRQAYQEAAVYALGLAERYLKDTFPTGYGTKIEFTIKGFSVGTYHDGQMSLAGE